jgi:hypothetical protein
MDYLIKARAERLDFDSVRQPYETLSARARSTSEIALPRILLETKKRQAHLRDSHLQTREKFP